MARMTDFERMVFETVFSVIFPRVANFTAGSNQTDYTLPGDGYNTTHDVPRVWVNGAEMLSGVSWVDTHTVRLSPGPTLGKNVKILVMPGALTGYLLRGGGLAMTGPLDMGGNPIINVGAGGTATAAAQRQELNLSSVLAGYLLKSGGQMTGVLNLGGNKITGGAAGVDPTDFVIKSQLPKEGYVVGDEKFWAGPANTVPTDWEIETGQMKDQTTDAALFAVLGHTYDTSTVTGKFFMPDPRGRFIRILGDGTTTIDKDGANRINGSNQDQDVQPHFHPMPQGAPQHTTDAHNHYTIEADHPQQTSPPTLNNTGKETRPVNQARYLIMKVR
jgi:microcystin-dependent protein